MILRKYHVHFGISVWQGSGHATPDKFEFSMKSITITCKYKLHVILLKYHVHFGISVWQGSGHATPDKFEFSMKSITITCEYKLHVILRKYHVHLEFQFGRAVGMLRLPNLNSA